MLKYFLKQRFNLIFCSIFALKSRSLPRKIMEQYRLCPAKLWSNAHFAPQNHRAFVLCPAKSQRLCYLPSKVMEQRRHCFAKSWRHSFMGSIFLTIFVNRCYFMDLYNPLDHFLRKFIFVSWYL